MMVGIRDRRELPFFQVRVHAVHAIRAETAGPRRLRAIGFYALLCQLANEQRHTGQHRVVRITYDALAARGQMSKRSVKLLLDALHAAQVVRYERLTDRATGAIISLLHLLILDEPWIGLTVAMADHLATPRDQGHLLRDLGLVVVLLEFCIEQRHEHGGLAAEVMRADIAARSGLTVDRVDDCNHALEHAGILAITRRRADNGGRYLPSLYTIAEAPRTPPQGGEMKPATRQNGTHMAAGRYLQGGEPVLPNRQNGTGKAEPEYPQGGDSATTGTESPPTTTRAGGSPEERQIENPLPAQSEHRATQARTGGGGALSPEQELCEALVAAWEPALGDSPRRDYEAHRSRWLAAARALLDRHPRERLSDALEYMVTDDILGSQALALPGFSKVADQLIARAYARRQRRMSTPGHAGVAADGLAWEEAKQMLERAVQRHGRDGRAAALDDLGVRSQQLVRFVQRVRWTALCEQPMRFVERRYAEIWAELADDVTRSSEENAA